MTIIPFEPHHAALIRPQDAQSADNAGGAAAGEGWTAVHDGAPVACFGVVLMWEGRGYCWALLDRDAGPHMLALTRAIRSLIAAAGLRRIEMAVDASFEAGRRWAGLLGFEPECLARGYFPDGRDAWLYARV